MAPDTESNHRREIGRRLRQTREALGFAKRPDLLRELLAQADVDYERDQLEKWEHGKAEPATWFLREMRRRYGVTSDWILLNDPERLPADLYNKLFSPPRKAG